MKKRSGDKIKLYKFRPLGNCNDLERVESIINERKFWCSKLWDLNDPMEGVYKNSNFNQEDSNNIFSDKNKYLICSFSGEKGFKNPLLWGYYANGFKGVAIEIEVESCDESIEQIKYVTNADFNKNMADAKEIITRKLGNWKHEDEYRFLTTDNQSKQKIGKISKVYFGNPYGDLSNTTQVIEASKSLKSYQRYKNRLIELCENKSIEYPDFSVGD